MAECAARGCMYHESRKSEEELPDAVTFHLFPKNPTLRAKWIKQMNQDDFQPGHASALCSLHFIKEYFVTDARGVQHLKPDAIPTEFEYENMIKMDVSDVNDEDVIACCAYKCSNTYNADSPITFHPFPLDQQELCDQWLLAMNVTQVAAKQAVLCSEHFDESCFVQGDNGERLIIADAVPSIFLYPDETENADNGDIALNIINENSINSEFNDAAIEVAQKHDNIVTALNEESARYAEMVRQRHKMEKEKRSIDFLLRTIINGGPVDKSRLRGLTSLVKTVDEVTQQIVVDCLAPCIAISQDSQEIIQE